MRPRILFCNMSYMQSYDNSVDDNPVNGGSYPEKEKDAWEKFNFQECEDGFYRGFVETKSNLGYEQAIKTNIFNKLHIERIDPAYKKEDKIDNVLVILCAKPKNGKNVIIGWYKNAIVYRDRQMYNGRFFNLQARIEESVLLEEDKRTFIIPRSNAKNATFGFGQSNIWYADSAETDSLIEAVINYINSESVELPDCQLPEEINEFVENGVGRTITVNAFERNAKARAECLKIHGTKCKICGFDAEKIYGIDFKDKIHVHHKVPIHTIGKEYKINPVTDLIPVCPNCHMILHTKVNGVEPTIEQVQQIVKK